MSMLKNINIVQCKVVYSIASLGFDVCFVDLLKKLLKSIAYQGRYANPEAGGSKLSEVWFR